MVSIDFGRHGEDYAACSAMAEKLILDFNPAWKFAGSNGMDLERIDELIRAGFELVEQFCYDHSEEFTHARWRGRIRTCNGVGSGGLAPSEVGAFDSELKRLLSNRYPDPMKVQHRLFCIVARKP